MEFVVGEKYKIDSGLGGAFTIKLLEIITKRGEPTHLRFAVTNPDFEDVRYMIPVHELKKVKPL